ncbi:MAG TPA: 30S ribosomal protein S6 [Spirochaetota bacterium]|nr:30S ribosomal protein S6 [Spirochaetota bacterium]
MRNYEFTVIIRSGKVEEGKNALKEILTKCEANVVSEEDWGLRRLAYEIDELKEAYYSHSILEATPDKVAKISALLRLNTVFLRFLFVVQDKKTA